MAIQSLNFAVLQSKGWAVKAIAAWEVIQNLMFWAAQSSACMAFPKSPPWQLNPHWVPSCSKVQVENAVAWRKKTQCWMPVVPQLSFIQRLLKTSINHQNHHWVAGGHHSKPKLHSLGKQSLGGPNHLRLGIQSKSDVFGCTDFDEHS